MLSPVVNAGEGVHRSGMKRGEGSRQAMLKVMLALKPTKPSPSTYSGEGAYRHSGGVKLASDAALC